VEAALAVPGVNVVGAELIAATDEDELYQDEVIAAIHEKGLYCWVNALSLGDYNHDYTPRKQLFSKLADDVSVIHDPALGWGKLMDKGIEIIQTDWPALLHDYRAKRG